MSDGEILVTLPGTTYTVTYFRPPGGRQLVSLRFPMKNDPRVQMNVSEFLIRAWKLAHNKARESRLDRLSLGFGRRPFAFFSLEADAAPGA
jgi:hypothetical protein